jgi:hypothetical protein
LFCAPLSTTAAQNKQPRWQNKQPRSQNMQAQATVAPESHLEDRFVYVGGHRLKTRHHGGKAEDTRIIKVGQ